MRLFSAILVAVAAIVAAMLPAVAEPIRIVVLGDSLTAGLGLRDPASEGFPAQLQAALRARGHDVTVVDAGVSGDTAAGGLARVDWSVGDDADGVIVELGANDMLRGYDPSATEESLGALIARLKERGKPVLLAGMRAAPNLGADYARAFDAIYPKLAETYDVLLYPFFLDGVAAVPSLNQADGIHPLASGVAVIVEGILPTAEAFVAEIAGTR